MEYFTLSPFMGRFAQIRFTTAIRLDLYETINDFLRDGIDVHTVLERVGNKYARINEQDIRCIVMREWSAAMDKGAMKFSEAIAGWVPASETMLISAGEEGGDLTGAIDNAIFASGTVKNMIGSVRSSLSYPALLLVALFLMIYGIATFMIPELAEMKPPEEWPPQSQGLYSVSVFTQQYWYWVLIGLVGGISAIVWTLPRVVGPIRNDVLDRIPPWNMYRSVQSSIFMISVAAQMKAGVPLTDAIENLRRLSNNYVANYLSGMLLSMNKGHDLGTALNNGFLDPEVGVKVEMVAETSGIENGIDSAGRKAIREAETAIASSTGVIKYIILGMLAGFIAWTFIGLNAVSTSLQSGATPGL